MIVSHKRLSAVQTNWRLMHKMVSYLEASSNNNPTLLHGFCVKPTFNAGVLSAFSWIIPNRFPWLFWEH
jgi:hypothetical protein